MGRLARIKRLERELNQMDETLTNEGVLEPLPTNLAPWAVKTEMEDRISEMYQKSEAARKIIDQWEQLIISLKDPDYIPRKNYISIE